MQYDVDEFRKQMDKIFIAESVKPGKVIESLKFKPTSKAKLYIPLCRMRPLEAVRPRLSNDVISLSTHFVSEGYMDGHGIFYVALQDHQGRTVDVSDEDRQSWSPLWKDANDKFDLRLRRDEHLKVFVGKMFHVWDGNHRLGAWLPIINRYHSDDSKWHYSVESIVLEVGNKVGALVSALTQVNW